VRSGGGCLGGRHCALPNESGRSQKRSVGWAGVSYGRAGQPIPADEAKEHCSSAESSSGESKRHKYICLCQLQHRLVTVPGDMFFIM